MRLSESAAPAAMLALAGLGVAGLARGRTARGEPVGMLMLNGKAIRVITFKISIWGFPKIVGFPPKSSILIGFPL